MIELKEITEKDLDWARELRNQNREYFTNSNEVSEEQHLKWFRNLDHPFYIIWREDGCVGTISITPRDGYHEIGNIIIAEEFRGQGVLRETIAIIQEMYQTPLVLKVKSDNIRAIKAYSKVGFEKRELVMWKE